MQRVKARKAGKGPEAEADKFLELPAVEKCLLSCKEELVSNGFSGNCRLFARRWEANWPAGKTNAEAAIGGSEGRGQGLVSVASLGGLFLANLIVFGKGRICV